jgi:hypothetical protein
MADKPVTDYDRRVAMQRIAEAFDKWRDADGGKLTCDECGDIIGFRQVGSTVHHDCLCGKYQGTMQSMINL